MSERGVFALDRGWFDHPCFANEPFTEREAWAWLISEASFKPRHKRIGSVVVPLIRGQVAASLRFMAEAWQWEHTRVRRFLGRLKTATMIEQQIEHGLTLITICNYNKYQRVSLPEATPNAPKNATATQQQRNKLEGTEDIETGSEAKASGAIAPRDVRFELFNRGLETLSRITGKGPDACRSFVGKCLKAASDDAIVVLGLIEDADRNRVVDPSAWIAARLKTGPPASSKPLTEFQRKQAETNDVRSQLRNLANGGGSSGKADRLLSVDHGKRPEDLRGGPGANLLTIPRAFGGGCDRPGNGPTVTLRLPADNEADQGISGAALAKRVPDAGTH